MGSAATVAAFKARAEDAENWRGRASCKDMDTRIFYEPRTRAEIALQTCARCPVRSECLEYGLTVDNDLGVRWGIFGGLLPEDRKRMMGKHKRHIMLGVGEDG